ncbi:MAG: isopenicillin N synthase family dioxygenase [Alphaproteobacteria bacterium]
MIPYTPPGAATNIPVIDLSGSFEPGSARDETVAAVHRACRETGFFYVSGHRVPEQLVAAQIEAAHRFFSMPEEAKQTVHISKSPYWRGYQGPGAQMLDEGSPPDHKESYSIACDLPKDHPWVIEGVPGQGPNQWPENLPGFPEQMLAYQAEAIRLGRHLMGLLACSVEVDYHYFAEGLGDPQCGVRLLRYPPQPAEAPENMLGAGAHTDWGSITILLQDGSPGLEVRNADGDWILATPIDGTFVINIGQMMERFTGGIYKANMHRVRNGVPDKARYSVATFFELEPQYRMGVAPTCLDAGADAPEFDLTVAEHIEQMSKASYAAS